MSIQSGLDRVSADSRFWKIDPILMLLTATLNLSDLATSVVGFWVGLGEHSVLLNQILVVYGVPWFALAKLGISLFVMLGYVLLRRRWQTMHPFYYFALMGVLAYFSVGLGYATIHNLILILQHP